MFKVNLLLFLATFRSLSGREADLRDVFYNIPPITPMVYGTAQCKTASVTYDLYNVRSDDWNKITISEMSTDFVKRRVTFVGIADKIEGIAQNYTITKGEILHIPVYGHGKHNMTFVGVKMKYNSRLRFYKKGEDLYMDWFDSTVDMSCERGYFYFENIKSTQISDVNEYIDENSAEYFAQVKPAYDRYCNAFFSYVLKPIINAVPFNKIFLP